MEGKCGKFWDNQVAVIKVSGLGLAFNLYLLI